MVRALSLVLVLLSCSGTATRVQDARDIVGQSAARTYHLITAYEPCAVWFASKTKEELIPWALKAEYRIFNIPCHTDLETKQEYCPDAQWIPDTPVTLVHSRVVVAGLPGVPSWKLDALLIHEQIHRVTNLPHPEVDALLLEGLAACGFEP